MGERPTLGFTADDRKVLNQLPVILQNITEKTTSIGDRVTRIEELKADRSEMRELERQIVSRLDDIRVWIGKVETGKGSAADVSDHETRLRLLETNTAGLPDAMKDMDQLKAWRWKTIGYAMGAAGALAGGIRLVEMLLTHR